MLNRDALYHPTHGFIPETEFFSFHPNIISPRVDLASIHEPQEYSTKADSYPLAFVHSAGKSPGVIFLPGFMSTMSSTKPRAIHQYCQEHGLEFTSLDYSGHGETLRNGGVGDAGNVGTISQWMEEALCILEHVTVHSHQIVVGSSMGAWIAILLAQYKQRHQAKGKACSRKVAGILGIASAPDFTIMIKEQIESDDDLKRQMNELGYCNLPTDYDDSGYYRISQEFLQDSTRHYVLDQSSIDLDIPITLMHGLQDKDVPFEYSESLFAKLRPKENKEMILVQDGDHRLSKPDDLEKILLALDRLRCRVLLEST